MWFSSGQLQPLRLLLLLTCLMAALFPSIEGKLAESCQDKRASLRCPSGSVVRIFCAVFGPAPRGKCPGGRHGLRKLSDRHCKPKQVASEVSKMCDGKGHCSVDIRGSQISRNCKGNQGYLRVRYSCVKGRDQCDQVRREAAKLAARAATKKGRKASGDLLRHLGQIWLDNRRCFQCNNLKGPGHHHLKLKQKSERHNNRYSHHKHRDSIRRTVRYHPNHRNEKVFFDRSHHKDWHNEHEHQHDRKDWKKKGKFGRHHDDKWHNEHEHQHDRKDWKKKGKFGRHHDDKWHNEHKRRHDRKDWKKKGKFGRHHDDKWHNEHEHQHDRKDWKKKGKFGNHHQPNWDNQNEPHRPEVKEKARPAPRRVIRRR